MRSIHIPFLPTNETIVSSPSTTTTPSSQNNNHHCCSSEITHETNTIATTIVSRDNKGNIPNNENNTSTIRSSNNEMIHNDHDNNDEEYVIISSEMMDTTTKAINYEAPTQQQQQQQPQEEEEVEANADHQKQQQQSSLSSNVQLIDGTVQKVMNDDTNENRVDDVEGNINNTVASSTTTPTPTSIVVPPTSISSSVRMLDDNMNETSMNCNSNNNNNNNTVPEQHNTQTNDDNNTSNNVHDTSSMSMSPTTPLHSEQIVVPVVSSASVNNITNQVQRQQCVVKEEVEDEDGPTLQSLPLDALHNIASFLTPKEWCYNFGTLNTNTLVLCRIVLQRVYMHAFKCLMEIIISYKYYKQYEDTLELIAIYIKNGIPIYPFCFGHAYHTIYWKMNINIREQEQQVLSSSIQNSNTASSTTTVTNTNNNNNNTVTDHTSTANNTGTNANLTATNVIATDPFYDTGRINHRIGYEYTYLEEKCRFYYNNNCPRNNDDHTNHSSNQNNNMNHNTTTTMNNHNHDRDVTYAAMLHRTNGANHHRRSPVTTTGTNSSSTPSTSNNTTSNNKVPIIIHQHLYDRHHIHHEYYIDIQNGTMNTPSINLSADFFHPYIHSNNNNNNDTYCNKTKKKNKKNTSHISAMNAQRIQHSLDQAERDILSLDNANHTETDTGVATTATNDNQLMLQESDDSTSTVSATPSINWPTSTPHINQVTDESSTDLAPLSMTDPLAPTNTSTSNAIVESCNVDVYCLSTMMSDTNNTNLQELRKHLLSRFTTYERRLETFLSKGDIYAYEECILDIWDEFFPHTTGIHYYDLETPVPRISNMHKFLTKPCPKAIGTIQCEIERIKITTRGKGMKGRLFPTYEYRLFIRHRPLPTTSTTNNNNTNDLEQDDNHNDNTTDNDNNTNNTNDFVRRDTVLMVAKNRGRKYTEHSGIIPLSTSATKKGSNNYYLYMAQQMDIDDHFRSCNAHLIEQKKYTTKMEPNGASRYPVMMMDSNNNNDTTIMGSNRLLGRLQSNFIGTEFQIFTPRIRKVQHGRKLMDDTNTNALCPPFHSDDEFEYDSGVSSDYNATTPTTTIRRTSRFGRFRRNNGTGSGDSANNGPATTPITSLLSTQPHFSTTNSDSGSVVSTPLIEHRTMHRTLSSPENLLSYYHQPVTQQQQRHSRISRRAIANDNNTPPGPLASPLASLSSPPQQQSSSVLLFEEEAGVITYTANLLGSRPRIMDVCIPKVTVDGVVGTEWRQYIESCYENDTMDDCRTMLSCFRQIQHRRESQDQAPPPPPPLPPPQQQPPIGLNNNNLNVMNNNSNPRNNEVDGITGDNNNSNGSNNSNMNLSESDYGLLALQNRPPWWNVELGSFVLNFGGRVSVASVKNFQLCNRTNQDYIMLQFGRIHGRHSFTMDFQHPLSAVQAFSIAISSLQSKISFG
jgi:hypothetical protein